MCVCVCVCVCMYGGACSKCVNVFGGGRAVPLLGAGYTRSESWTVCGLYDVCVDHVI